MSLDIAFTVIYPVCYLGGDISDLNSESTILNLMWSAEYDKQVSSLIYLILPGNYLDIAKKQAAAFSSNERSDLFYFIFIYLWFYIVLNFIIWGKR